MKTVNEVTEYKLVIKKSVFIGMLYPINDENAFRLAFENVKKQHPQATHITYSVKCGNFIKSSDAKEPSHVAGSQIEGQIVKAGLDNVALFVVRYFGGVKLGKAGLCAAYRQCAQETIENAKVGMLVCAAAAQIDTTFAAKNVSKLENIGAKVVFSMDFATLVFYQPCEKAKEIVKQHFGVELDFKEKKEFLWQQ